MIEDVFQDLDIPDYAELRAKINKQYIGTLKRNISKSIRELDYDIDLEEKTIKAVEKKSRRNKYNYCKINPNFNHNLYKVLKTIIAIDAKDIKHMIEGYTNTIRDNKDYSYDKKARAKHLMAIDELENRLDEDYYGTVNIFSQIKLAAWLAIITWQQNLIAQVPFFQGASYSDTFYIPIEYQQHA